jgi:hypothetical protein
VRGVIRANNKIKVLYEDKGKIIEYIEFIEQYNDRAVTCFYALSKMETEFEFDVPVVVGNRRISSRPGSKQRLPGDSNDEWWTRLNVQLENVQSFRSDMLKDTERVVQNFRFTISTGGAREELRNLYSSKAIIDKLIADISVNHQWTPEMAKTFFELVIPNDFKQQVKKQQNMSWIVDKHTAGYPWELLQDQASNTKPLCVNSGMVRQLATRDYNLRINPVTDNKALVIADPDLSGSSINQLPGALREGQLVINLLNNNGYDTSKSLIRGASASIIQQLFSDGYKIVHLAGHGFFDEKAPEIGGMVIGNNVFLSSREIIQMSSVPELVIVNCCFLGKTDGVAEEYYRNRYKMAANIGVQLIENGVKAVIAAGWEVNDEAALKFTEIFYNCMFNDYTFGDAVQKARSTVYQLYGSDNNTWGAYQCYGDPYYQLSSVARKRNKPYDFVIPEQALIELNNLSSAIEMGGSPIEDYKAKLDAISEAVDSAGLRVDAGSITEMEAFILSNLYDYDMASQKFRALRNMESASYSMMAMEASCLVACKQLGISCKRNITAFQARKAVKAAAVKAYSTRTRKQTVANLKVLVRDINQLLQVSKTAERYLMMGNVYWQIAVFEDQASRKIAALSTAAYYYSKGYEKTDSFYRAYGLIYWMEIEAVLIKAKKHSWGQTVRVGRNSYTLPSSLKDAVSKMETFKADRLSGGPGVKEYWKEFMPTAVEFATWLLGPDSSPQGVLTSYTDVWKKVGSPGKKRDEVDHMRMLPDLLSLGNGAGMKQLRKNIENIGTALEELV